jgi:hypothetical protein
VLWVLVVVGIHIVVLKLCQTLQALADVRIVYSHHLLIIWLVVVPVIIINFLAVYTLPLPRWWGQELRWADALIPRVVRSVRHLIIVHLPLITRLIMLWVRVLAAKRLAPVIWLLRVCLQNLISIGATIIILVPLLTFVVGLSIKLHFIAGSINRDIKTEEDTIDDTLMLHYLVEISHHILYIREIIHLNL